MNETTAKQVEPRAADTLTRAAASAPVLLAMLLGAGIVFAAGFMQIGPAHNAAHDSRHTVAFPCH